MTASKAFAARGRRGLYRKGHRYLTVVADHDREGRVVWAQAARAPPPSWPSSTSWGRTAWRNSRPSAWI